MLKKYTSEKKVMVEKRKAFFPTTQKGDIFVSIWGFEQKNVDFYLVLSVKFKIGTFIKIGSKIVEDIMKSHEMECEVLPVISGTIGELFRKQILMQEGGESIRLERYEHCSKWLGRPVLKSWFYQH